MTKMRIPVESTLLYDWYFFTNYSLEMRPWGSVTSLHCISASFSGAEPPYATQRKPPCGWVQPTISTLKSDPPTCGNMPPECFAQSTFIFR